MQVHLIDGTFELFRSFYGAPASQNGQGREVGAARAFARSLNALLQQSDVTHVAIAFDHVIESFRNQLFEGYKTGEGIDPALRQQFDLVEQAAGALGVVVWPMVEFEADDALATAAWRYAEEPAVSQVVLCSPDKDLAQCTVEPKIVCWDRIRDKRMDASGVEDKFGVLPESIPDYLALVGDTADGIPGIPRWGAKSTAQVLRHYVHLEHIPEDAKSWAVKVRGATTLAQNLEQSREAAVLYRELATLRRDVPLEQSLADLEYQGADKQKLEVFCAEVADDSLLTRARFL